MASLADLRVQVDAFEGPLSLLLRLIECEDLEVTRVSLVAVADSFVALVSQARETDLSAIGEFVAVAARLLMIKSRALLQVPSSTALDSLEPDDAETLARQVAAYRPFQQLATWLGERREGYLVTLPRPPVRTPAQSPRPPALQPLALQRAAARLLAPPPIEIREEEWPDIDYQTLRQGLLNTLAGYKQSTFEQLCSGAGHPLVVITLFLALLDTVRGRLVQADQPHAQGPIHLALAQETAWDAE